MDLRREEQRNCHLEVTGGSNSSKEFLGGPVIKTQGFHSSGPGSIPVGGDEI